MGVFNDILNDLAYLKFNFGGRRVRWPFCFGFEVGQSDQNDEAKDPNCKLTICIVLKNFQSYFLRLNVFSFTLIFLHAEVAVVSVTALFTAVERVPRIAYFHASELIDGCAEDCFQGFFDFSSMSDIIEGQSKGEENGYGGDGGNAE